jgi:GTP-sensing pleiotropic transcriptional regulator CodY
VARKKPLVQVSAEVLENQIYIVRGQRVMLDSDLAELYGVPTKIVNQAVRRNTKRFPDDFAFQLTLQEVAALRSQIVTSNKGRGGRRYPLGHSPNTASP